MYRAYFIDSNGVSIAGTSATPALYIATAAAADANITRIRVSCEAVSSPAPPSNGSILAQLSVVTGTVAGGATVTARQLSGVALAAQTTFKSGSTALTGLTQGNTIWAHPIPFAAGASWEDAFENTGFHRNLQAGVLYAVYFTAASGAGSGMGFKVTADFSE